MVTFNEIQDRYKQKKQRLRIRLGFLQLIHKPFYNLIWIVIVTASLLTAWGRKTAVDYLAHDNVIPSMLHPVFYWLVTVTAVILPILFVLSMVEWIGERTARRSESSLVIAFDAKHLIHKCPVLMDIYRIKGTGVTVREFYSLIPYKDWIEKQDAIADAMNVHFVEEI